MLAAIHPVSSTGVANTALLYVSIGTGVTALITFIAVAVRWLMNQGASEARSAARDQETQRRLLAIEKKVTPNGKDTQQIGDITARVEDKVDRIAEDLGDKLDELNSKVERHIGAEEQSRKDMWREINILKREAKA